MRHFEIPGLSEPATSLRCLKAAQRLVRILKRDFGGAAILTGL